MRLLSRITLMVVALSVAVWPLVARRSQADDTPVANHYWLKFTGVGPDALTIEVTSDDKGHFAATRDTGDTVYALAGTLGTVRNGKIRVNFGFECAGLRHSEGRGLSASFPLDGLPHPPSSVRSHMASHMPSHPDTLMVSVKVRPFHHRPN